MMFNYFFFINYKLILFKYIYISFTLILEIHFSIEFYFCHENLFLKN